MQDIVSHLKCFSFFKFTSVKNLVYRVKPTKLYKMQPASAAPALRACVLQSLNYYQYENATFLAERHHAEGMASVHLFV